MNGRVAKKLRREARRYAEEQIATMREQFMRAMAEAEAVKNKAIEASTPPAEPAA